MKLRDTCNIKKPHQTYETTEIIRVNKNTKLPF